MQVLSEYTTDTKLDFSSLTGCKWDKNFHPTKNEMLILPKLNRSLLKTVAFPLTRLNENNYIIRVFAIACDTFPLISRHETCEISSQYFSWTVFFYIIYDTKILLRNTMMYDIIFLLNIITYTYGKRGLLIFTWLKTCIWVLHKIIGKYLMHALQKFWKLCGCNFVFY